MSLLDFGIAAFSFPVSILVTWYLLGPLFRGSDGRPLPAAAETDRAEDILLQSLEAIEHDYLAGKLTAAERDELRAEILSEDSSSSEAR